MDATRIVPLRRRERNEGEAHATFLHTQPGYRCESVGADFETPAEPETLPTPSFRLFLVAVVIVVALAALVIYRSAT